jgi:hypothetical protein
MQSTPVIQRIVSILWPSFITAGIATILFFTAFDPDVIFVDYDISRLGAYSIGFFIFWLFGIATAMLTCFFMRPCEVFNKQNRPASDNDAG